LAEQRYPRGSGSEPGTGISYDSPRRFFIVLIVAIFAAEAVVMAVLHFFAELHDSPVYKAILDSFLLTVIVSPILYLLFFRPLSQQIRARERIQAQVRKLSTAVEHASCKVIITDLDGNIDYVNPRFTQETGYSAEEVIGRNPRLLKSGETPPETYPHLWETIKTGGEWHGEFLNKTKDGRLVWDFATISPIRNPEGAITHNLGIQQDITERKQLEQALQTSQAEFRNLVMKNKTGIIIVNRDGQFMFVNPAAESFLGRPKEKLLGEPFGIPLESSDITEIDVVRADGSNGVAELGITDTEWEGKQNYLVMLQDVTARKEAEAVIEQMAYHDKLTGLPNRVLFLDRLNLALSFSDRNKQRLAVLFLDLDGFKTINDTLGHGAGDLLLHEVAQRLNGCVRSSDTVARLGGDEFILLLLNISHDEDAGEVARKINNALKAPLQIEGQELFITSSIGIALYPKDNEDPNILIKNADAAMYRAKEKGKDSYQFYSSSIGDESYS